MSNVIPIRPGVVEAAPIERAAKLLAARWEIRYVAATDDFLVWDKTAKILHGQAVVCADETAVLRFIVNALRDEVAR